MTVITNAIEGLRCTQQWYASPETRVSCNLAKIIKGVMKIVGTALMARVLHGALLKGGRYYTALPVCLFLSQRMFMEAGGILSIIYGGVALLRSELPKGIGMVFIGCIALLGSHNAEIEERTFKKDPKDWGEKRLNDWSESLASRYFAQKRVE